LKWKIQRADRGWKGGDKGTERIKYTRIATTQEKRGKMFTGTSVGDIVECSDRSAGWHTGRDIAGLCRSEGE
jgi:hypothetical protein